MLVVLFVIVSDRAAGATGETTFFYEVPLLSTVAVSIPTNLSIINGVVDGSSGATNSVSIRIGGLGKSVGSGSLATEMDSFTSVSIRIGGLGKLVGSGSLATETDSFTSVSDWSVMSTQMLHPILQTIIVETKTISITHLEVGENVTRGIL